MAIVKNPALSSEASGNLGGICYSRWRELQIARAAWTGVVPNTPAQQTYQNCLDMAARWWSDFLSSAMRQAWRELATTMRWKSRLGTEFQPSGYHLWMKWSMQRCVLGLTLQVWPQTPEVQAYPTTFHVVYNIWADRIRLDMRDWVGSGDPYAIQYWRAGPYDGGGRRALQGEYRLKVNWTNPVANFQWFDLDVVLNKWYWYKARFVREWGEVGPFFYCHGQKVDAGAWPPRTYCRDNS